MTEETELRLAAPNPALPIQDIKMALCLNCNKPILEVEGIGWNHGHNGNPDCDAEAPGSEARELAERVMRGEALPEDLRPPETHDVGLDG